MSKELMTIEKAAIDRLDAAANTALAVNTLAGRFERTFGMASAMVELQTALDQQGVMDNIMSLQGSPLGFRTDKDKTGGYPVEVVRDCMIEATMQGVYPVGNEFNIIAGRCYITKEGYGRKLKELPGVTNLVELPGIPAMKPNGAVVEMRMVCDYAGEHTDETLPFAIRVNSGMGSDAILGKATRKARKWLFEKVTGIETPGGEVDDGPVIDITAEVSDTDDFADLKKTMAKPIKHDPVPSTEAPTVAEMCAPLHPDPATVLAYFKQVEGDWHVSRSLKEFSHERKKDIITKAYGWKKLIREWLAKLDTQDNA